MMSTGLISNLLSIQPQTSTPAGQMEVKMLPREYIMRNPDNKIYVVGDIDKLKEDIRLHGVRQPLEVIRWANGYKLIGGERRLTACEELAKEGDNRFESLPCIIVESKGELDDKIALITANATARDLTDGERLAQYEALKEALTHKKRDGKLEGKVRDEVCRILGLSTGAAARLNVIASCQNELIKERLMSGDIGLMQAYQAAQDYTRFTEANAEELEAQKEQNSKAPVTVLESSEYPEWVIQAAKEVCEEDFAKTAAAFTAKDLAANVGSLCGRSLKTGYVAFERSGLRFWYKAEESKYTFTWAKFVKFCIEQGIATKPSTTPAASLPQKTPAAPEPRGHGTLVQLASKALSSLAAWELNLEEPAFKLTYYTKKLPGGAMLWKQVDGVREDEGKTDTTRYAIILQDYGFFTCGWITQTDIMQELVRYFELK